VSLFEYSLQRMLLRHLGANFGVGPRETKYYSASAVRGPLVQLLGVLAMRAIEMPHKRTGVCPWRAMCFDLGHAAAAVARHGNLQSLDAALTALEWRRRQSSDVALAGCRLRRC